jgi:hypothetical protein
MTHRTGRPAPPTPAAAPAALPRLTLVWAEAVTMPALSLAWSALRLWDYPRPEPAPACGAVSPEPR